MHILGSEGRPYLIQGLESPYAENRRAALEALTVSDMRSYGEEGRQMLIKLAGDHGDMRSPRPSHSLSDTMEQGHSRPLNRDQKSDVRSQIGKHGIVQLTADN